MARRIWRLALVIVLAAWAVLLVAWLALHTLVLGRLDTWRPRIEAAINQRLAPEGLTLRIASLSARTGQWVPTFTAQELTLHNAQGEVMLHVPRLVAMVSARSLLRGEPVFRQIVIESPRLTVHRDVQGRWQVAGIALQPDAQRGSATADWVLTQPEILVRAGQVRWQDDASGQPAAELTGVDLLLRHGLHRHRWRLDVTPPPAWGQRYSVRGDFTHGLLARAGDVAQWRGSLYADAPLLDWTALKPHLQLPVTVGTGRGALRAWLTRTPGRWQAATLDVALVDVQGRAAGELPPLRWRALQGRLHVQRDGDRYEADTQGVQGQMQDGTPWPAGDVVLRWRQRSDSAVGDVAAIEGGELQVPALALAGATELALRLPLPAPMRQTLQDVAPQGQVSDFALRWQGPPDAPSDWRAGFVASGLALRAEHAGDPNALGRPGVRGLRAEVQASHDGGTARVQIENGAVTFPGVFAEPEIALTRADAHVSWTVTPAADGPPAVALRVQGATFANADAQGSLDGRWQTGAGQGVGAGKRLPGRIDLDGVITQGQGTQVVRYLPLEIPAGTRHYVATAVRSGRIENARFAVQGDLWDFPYAHGEPGVFRIGGRVRDLELAYVPPGLVAEDDTGWPPFTDVTGELVFDRARMQIKDASARLWGVALSGVQGEIPNLGADAPELHVQGSGRGPAVDALRFLEATPIAGWMAHALGEARASGPAGLELALTIPLLSAKDTRLKGRITLAGNDVRLRPDVPMLAAASGEVVFTEHDFQVRAGKATVLGGPATFAGGTQPDGSLHFNGQGVATAMGLRTEAAWSAAAPAARTLTGQAAYTVALGLRDGQAEVRVDSDLQGLAIDLPAPLHKPSQAAWPLHIATRLDADAHRDTLDVILADAGRARYRRELGSGAARVESGGIAIGPGEPPRPERGVQAQIELPKLDADAWRARLAGLQVGGDGADSGYAPTEVDLRTVDLTAGGLHWPDQQIQARAAAAAGQWLLTLDGPHAKGRVEASAQRVQARLARLVLQGVQAGQSPLREEGGDWPALDVVVDELVWRDQPWGRLTLVAQNRGRNWQVDELDLRGNSASLAATGLWEVGSRTALTGTLTLTDAGRLIEHMGLGPLVRGGKGEIKGELAWPGGPTDVSRAQLTGTLELDVASGQFLQAEPGAARLLGILNLQALPRRLALDFRDVFAEGFTFDQIDGQLQLADGLARTHNLRIRGVQAIILVEGQADLGRETQDLHVVIVPEINAGTAALAYAAINPVLGLGTFAAQFLLRKPLQDANTRELRITGSWDEPKIETLNRPTEDATP